MNKKRIWPCLFGLRCARLVVTPQKGVVMPEGIKLVADYTCAGCGTRYRGNGWHRKKMPEQTAEILQFPVNGSPKGGE